MTQILQTKVLGTLITLSRDGFGPYHVTSSGPRGIVTTVVNPSCISMVGRNGFSVAGEIYEDAMIEAARPN